jgi:hypothetical protein
LSAKREFLIKLVSGTVFEVLWPERMARARRRRHSLRGIAVGAVAGALGRQYAAGTGTGSMSSMRDAAHAVELGDRLRVDLERRLAPQGWTLVPSEGFVPIMSFVRAIDDDFSATAEILTMGRPRHLPVRIHQLLLGVSYEPLRRLLVVLDDDLGSSALSEPIDSIVEREPNWRIELAQPSDVDRAADGLAGLILSHGLAYAERYATIDRLLGAHRDDDSNEFGVMVPLLLASAGRIGEARQALAVYRPHDEQDVGPGEKALAQRLGEWLDSAANPPTASPPVDNA